MEAIATRSTLSHFAAMFAYPDASLPRTAKECAALLDFENPAAASLVGNFAAFAAANEIAQIEEAYTSLFDLDPKCALYVGYHLFGESYKRSAFLLGLNQHFGAQAFTPSGELPDHLTVVLHSLAASSDETLCQELITDAVLPALDKMTGHTPSPESPDAPEADPAPEELAAQRAPFIDLLDALRLVLQDASLANASGGSRDG